MKIWKRIDLFKKFYEAIYYTDKEHNIESIQPETSKEILKSMKAELEAKKKENRKIEKRIRKKLRKFQ